MRLNKFLLLAVFVTLMFAVLSAQNSTIKSTLKQQSNIEQDEDLKKEVEVQKSDSKKKVEKKVEKKIQKQVKNKKVEQVEKKQSVKKSTSKKYKQTSNSQKVVNSQSSKQLNTSSKISSKTSNKTSNKASSKISSKTKNQKRPIYTQTTVKKQLNVKKTPSFDSRNLKIEHKEIVNPTHELQQKPRVEKKKIHQGSGYHQPHVVTEHQHVNYSSPRYYDYYIPPRYIYRGIWIRYYIDLADGYTFYNGYPYFVYNNYLHRYSVEDTGYYDLVDSWNDETYATFYGDTLKDSYDRCADLRDRLNYEYGEERYFCSERFEYDPDYKYGWDPDDYPDWYWY